MRLVGEYTQQATHLHDILYMYVCSCNYNFYPLTSYGEWTHTKLHVCVYNTLGVL